MVLRETLAVAICIGLLTHGAPTNAAQRNLAKVLDPEMITANVPYFERVAGPARNTYGNTRVYNVDGCEVWATVSGSSIRSLRLPLAKRCTLSLAKFLPNVGRLLPSANSLTFGAFDKATGGKGRFLADCLSLCGNAADPVVYEYWTAPRSDQALEIALEAVQVSDSALEAADKWQQAMERSEGNDWVVDTKFNCSPYRYDPLAHKLFQNVVVTAITIGYDLDVPRCGR